MNEGIPNKELVQSTLEIEPNYTGYIPQDFTKDPLSYFETHGVNIKEGEILYDESGQIREDPTAVKDLPVWENVEGQKLYTVAKKVNLSKGKVAKANDPFYEYQIMEYVQSKGLPCPKPIAKISKGNEHLIVMERVPGLRWSYRKDLIKQGFSDEEVNELHEKAEVMMNQLQQEFEAQGVIRGWKLSDMIFDIDVEHKEIRSLTPVDWERTKVVPTDIK